VIHSIAVSTPSPMKTKKISSEVYTVLQQILKQKIPSYWHSLGSRFHLRVLCSVVRRQEGAPWRFQVDTVRLLGALTTPHRRHRARPTSGGNGLPSPRFCGHPEASEARRSSHMGAARFHPCLAPLSCPPLSRTPLFPTPVPHPPPAHPCPAPPSCSSLSLTPLLHWRGLLSSPPALALPRSRKAPSPPPSSSIYTTRFSHPCLTMAARGSGAGGGCAGRGSSLSPPLLLPSSSSRGQAPPVADVVVEHVALLQWHIGGGIPARTAVDAVEAALFGAPAGTGAPSIAERVLDRALPPKNGRGGPADGGCVGCRAPRGGPATTRGDQDAAERRDGQDVSRRRLLPGSQEGASEPLAATDSAIFGADAVQPGVIVVDDDGPLLLGGQQGASAPLAVADSAGGVADAVEAGIIAVGGDALLTVAAVPAAEHGAVDGDVAVVDEDARPAVEEARAAAVGDAAVPSRVGTHRQKAEDLLRASPLGGTSGSLPSWEGGMALDSQPIALTYPLPPSSTDPLASEVILIVDDRETTGSGFSRSAFLSRLRPKPGLTGRIVTRRLPCGDATLVARVTTAGAGALPGTPAAGTDLILDQLVERKTAADVVSSMRDERLAKQLYWMLASGRLSLTFLIEGSVEAATRGDAAMRRDVGAFLPSLSVENNIFVKGTDNTSETVQYYASMTRHRSRRLGNADGLAAWL